MIRSLPPLVAGVLLLLPIAAHADTYSVFSCKGPVEQATAAGGWAGDRQSDAFASNDCATGGPLAVGLTGGGPWNGGIGAEQRFTAPAGTRVAFLRLTRRTSGLVGAKGLAYYLLADDKVIDACDPAAAKCTADLDGVLDLPALDAGTVRFKAGCFESYPDQCTSAGTPLRVEVPKAVVGLKDTTPPAVASPSGTLTSAATNVVGPLALTFNASDTGGGLYRLVTTIDGTSTFSAVAGGDCTDADISNSDPYEFFAPVPCPPSVNGLSAAVDTTLLSNGQHTVDVLVEDAAGNRTSVLGSKTFTTANPLPPALAGEGPANGVGADVFGRLRVSFDANAKKTIRTRYGRRTVVRGTLVDRAGKGIQGARIDVYHRARGSKKQIVKTGLKTRANGKLTLILPLDLTSRDVIMTYRARRPGPITSSQKLTLTVLDKAGRVLTKRPGKLGRVG